MMGSTVIDDNTTTVEPFIKSESGIEFSYKFKFFHTLTFLETFSTSKEHKTKVENCKQAALTNKTLA